MPINNRDSATASDPRTSPPYHRRAGFTGGRTANASSGSIGATLAIGAALALGAHVGGSSSSVDGGSIAHAWQAIVSVAKIVIVAKVRMPPTLAIARPRAVGAKPPLTRTARTWVANTQCRCNFTLCARHHTDSSPRGFSQ
jgi:hypothetical protein